MKQLKKKTNLGLAALLILLFFVFNFYPVYSLNQKYQMYLPSPVISESDYHALLSIRDAYGINNIIITPYFMTSAVYPVSGNRVISITPAQLEGGLTQDNLDFFSYDCNKKKEIIAETKSKYILSKIALDCNYLEYVFNYGNTYFYKIK